MCGAARKTYLGSAVFYSFFFSFKKGFSMNFPHILEMAGNSSRLRSPKELSLRPKLQLVTTFTVFTTYHI